MFLIPVQSDYLAAEGMTELIGTVQSIKRQINPRLRVGGVFLTMANETNFRKDIVRSVKETYLALIVRMPEEIGNVANYRGTDAPKVELGVIVDASQVPATAP